MPINNQTRQSISTINKAKNASSQFSSLMGKKSEGSDNTPADITALISSIQDIVNKQAHSSILLRGLSIDRIKANDWRAKYPYSLLILKAVRGSNNKVSYILEKNLRFTLPITPSQITVNTIFASQLTLGSRGILEEHNGIGIKQIQISGTTGIFLKRPSFTAENKQQSPLETIFAGTIAAANALRNTIRAVTGKALNNNAGKPPTPTDELYSGYYQYHLLRSFLEAYAMLKKAPGGEGYRLGLEMGKDRVIYLVTPQTFNTVRSQSSPMEYNWSFTATAWGTVSDTNLLSAKDEASAFFGSSISKTQKALNALRNVRNVVLASQDLIRAVGSDIQVNIIGPIQSVVLALKDIMGTPAVVSDVITGLDNSMKSLIFNSMINQWSIFKQGIDGVNDMSFQLFELAATSTLSEQDPSTTTNTPATELSSGDIIDILDQTGIDGLSLPPETQQIIQQYIEDSINNVDSNTINSLIESINNTANSLSEIAEQQGVDSDAWRLMDALYMSLEDLYYLKSSGLFAPKSTTDQATGENSIVNFYQERVLEGGGITVKPNGKFAIPFPLGATLEWLAQRYLGSAERWHEIAAVNNLKPPYIDEEGFVRPFLTNGVGNQFVIADASNLIVGQKVWIFSNTKKINKRTIKVIQKITENQYIITVDGDDDLDEYLLADEAKLKAYLPYTVNSQKIIYIPTTESSTIDPIQIKSIAYIDEDKTLLNFSKVDFLLSQDGDLVIAKDGFINLSYGKNNLIQAARLKLQTVMGGLLLHPDYGAGVSVGESISDVSIDDIINRIQSSFESDPRFAGVSKIEINAKDTGAIKINIDALAANNFGVVPLEFEL